MNIKKSHLTTILSATFLLAAAIPASLFALPVSSTAVPTPTPIQTNSFNLHEISMSLKGIPGVSDELINRINQLPNSLRIACISDLLTLHSLHKEIFNPMHTIDQLALLTSSAAQNNYKIKLATLDQKRQEYLIGLSGIKNKYKIQPLSNTLLSTTKAIPTTSAYILAAAQNNAATCGGITNPSYQGELSGETFSCFCSGTSSEVWKATQRYVNRTSACGGTYQVELATWSYAEERIYNPLDQTQLLYCMTYMTEHTSTILDEFFTAARSCPGRRCPTATPTASPSASRTVSPLTSPAASIPSSPNVAAIQSSSPTTRVTASPSQTTSATPTSTPTATPSSCVEIPYRNYDPTCAYQESRWRSVQNLSSCWIQEPEGTVLGIQGTAQDYSMTKTITQVAACGDITGPDLNWETAVTGSMDEPSGTREIACRPWRGN
jgi:hypothetical protein